jgi:hypothetical protein
MPIQYTLTSNNTKDTTCFSSTKKKSKSSAHWSAWVTSVQYGAMAGTLTTISLIHSENFGIMQFLCFLSANTLDTRGECRYNTRMTNNNTTKGNTMVFGINSLVSVNGESYRVEELREDCVFLSDKDGAEIQVNYEDIDLT